jgi:hypothetical protein
VNGDHPMLDRIIIDMEERFGIPVATIRMGMKGEGAEELPRAFHLALGLGLKEV